MSYERPFTISIVICVSWNGINSFPPVYSLCFLLFFLATLLCVCEWWIFIFYLILSSQCWPIKLIHHIYALAMRLILSPQRASSLTRSSKQENFHQQNTSVAINTFNHQHLPWVWYIFEFLSRYSIIIDSELLQMYVTQVCTVILHFYIVLPCCVTVTRSRCY